MMNLIQPIHSRHHHLSGCPTSTQSLGFVLCMGLILSTWSTIFIHFFFFFSSFLGPPSFSPPFLHHHDYRYHGSETTMYSSSL